MTDSVKKKIDIKASYFIYSFSHFFRTFIIYKDKIIVLYEIYETGLSVFQN